MRAGTPLAFTAQIFNLFLNLIKTIIKLWLKKYFWFRIIVKIISFIIWPISKIFRLLSYYKFIRGLLILLGLMFGFNWDFFNDVIFKYISFTTIFWTICNKCLWQLMKFLNWIISILMEVYGNIPTSEASLSSDTKSSIPEYSLKEDYKDPSKESIHETISEYVKEVDNYSAMDSEEQLSKHKAHLQKSLKDSFNWNLELDEQKQVNSWYSNKAVWVLGAISVIIIGGAVYYWYIQNPTVKPANDLIFDVDQIEKAEPTPPSPPVSPTDITVSDERTKSIWQAFVPDFENRWSEYNSVFVNPNTSTESLSSTSSQETVKAVSASASSGVASTSATTVEGVVQNTTKPSYAAIVGLEPKNPGSNS